MHELSITKSILDYSLKEAKKVQATKIRAIHLLLGPFSGIVPECIQMYMELLAEGTIAQGVKIQAKILPLKVRCRDCGRESEITRRHIACPFCNSLKLQILSANDFIIESLEVDTDGDQSPSSGHGME